MVDYRKEIDGLRALAVVPVVMFHAGFELFGGGFVGVDVFFVISGFLITSIILSELERGEFSIVRFYERRARRILPALFFVMLCCLPFAWLWLLPQDMKSFAQSVIAVPLFVSNILFKRTSGYFDSAAELKPLLHTWSLAVEEQYYVVIPLLMLLLWRFGRRSLLVVLAGIGVLSLGAAQIGAQANPTATFYLLGTRAWELLVGAAAAFYFSAGLAWHTRVRLAEVLGGLGLALILFSVFFYDKQTPFPGLYALVPTLGALLIILFASPQTRVGQLLAWRPIVFVGLLSYSIYLWHQPLFAFARHRLLGEPPLELLLALGVLTFGLAYLSWRFVETPFRDKGWITRKQVFTGALLGSMLFVVLGAIGYRTDGLPQRFDAALLEILRVEKDKSPSEGRCLYSGKNYPAPEKACTIGKAEDIRGVLLGDSHADAIANALGRDLAERGIGFRRLTYSGCPPVLDVYRVDTKSESFCHEFNRRVFEHVVGDPTIRHVVLVARWPQYLERARFDNGEGGVELGGDNYVDGLENGVKTRNDEVQRRRVVMARYRETVERYLQAGKQVVLVYPVPEVGYDTPVYLAKKMLFEGGSGIVLSTSQAAYAARNRNTIAAFDAIDHEHLVRVRPSEIFCNNELPGRCIANKGQEVFYYDDDHLAQAGARRLSAELMKKIPD